MLDVRKFDILCSLYNNVTILISVFINFCHVKMMILKRFCEEDFGVPVKVTWTP